MNLKPARVGIAAELVVFQVDVVDDLGDGAKRPHELPDVRGGSGDAGRAAALYGTDRLAPTH